VGIVHALARPNGYWAPMTALLVLSRSCARPNPRLDVHRTLAGAGLAGSSALAAPSGAALLVLTLSAAWFCLRLARTDYVVFTVAITATIVFVLAVDHTSEMLTAWHRLLATMLGGALRCPLLTSPQWVASADAVRSELYHR